MKSARITIIEVGVKCVIGTLFDTDKKIYFDPEKLPDNIEVGDKFYHIEHGCIVDIYDKDGNCKEGLFNYRNAVIPCIEP